MTPRSEKKKGVFWSEKRKDLLFYTIAIALPVLQFCIFYIGVNFNSILLSFQKFNREENAFLFCGFENFQNVFKEFFTGFTLKNGFFNSLKVWVLTTVISLPLSMLFSYFIYKKFPLAKFFKVALFLPQVISGIVTVVIYMYFIERAIPALSEALFHKSFEGWLSNPETRFGALLFYNVFYSFGGYILLFLGGMNGVDPAVVEAGKIDGATGFKEFWYIVMPEIYPTFTTFFVLGVAGIFSNQFALFSFYGIEAGSNVMTFGYYLYAQTSVATDAEYPRLAAIGLIMTLLIVPVTLLVKRGLEKLGPKET